MVKNIVRLLTLFCGALIFPALCYEPCDSALQKSLQTFYDKCMQRGYLADVHRGQAHITFARLAHNEDDGLAALHLIEWLEKQHDVNSVLLLSAINELCTIKFTQIMNNLDGAKDREALIEKFQHLADTEVEIQGVAYKPFQTIMSKMFLTIAIVNAKKLKYEQKKEALVFVLNKIRKEMLAINSKLGENKVQDSGIREFVVALEVYAVRMPVVNKGKSFLFSPAVIMSVLLLVIIVAVIVVIYFCPQLTDKVMKYLDEHIVQRLVKVATDAYKKFVDEVAHATAANLSFPLRRAFFSGAAIEGQLVAGVVPQPAAPSAQVPVGAPSALAQARNLAHVPAVGPSQPSQPAQIRQHRVQLQSAMVPPQGPSQGSQPSAMARVGNFFRGLGDLVGAPQDDNGSALPVDPLGVGAY
ncbi:MAG: hypothetical protein WCW33_01860 [Candidatus Babeliales bacterium]